MTELVGLFPTLLSDAYSAVIYKNAHESVSDRHTDRKSSQVKSPLFI